jgi:hypothetical protein
MSINYLLLQRALLDVLSERCFLDSGRSKWTLEENTKRLDDILKTLADASDAELGDFFTEKECQRSIEKHMRVARDRFYTAVLKYMRGEYNNIEPEMDQYVKIAKTIVERDQTLLLSINKDRLRSEIDAFYKGNQSIEVDQ